ncbi:hypothetical protein ACFPM0_07615 [Pseudonocardia sulfidoxydans]
MSGDSRYSDYRHSRGLSVPVVRVAASFRASLLVSPCTPTPTVRC